jgi:hypothetical protein
MKRAIVLAITLGAMLGTAASAQSNFFVGLKWGIPTGSWGGSNPYVAGDHHGYSGFDILYGLKLGTKLGCTLGAGFMGFERGNWKHELVSYQDLEPYDAARSNYYYLALGAYRAVLENSLDIYANCFYGIYLIDRNRIEETFDGSGAPHFVIYSTDMLRQNGVVALEVGARKRIKWGIWAGASYNYAPLDKKQVKADSMQWVALGLGYAWGRR